MLIGILVFYRKFFSYMSCKIDPGYIFCQNRPNQKNISNRVNGTDIETLDARGPKFAGNNKGVYSVRTYFGKTRPIPEFLYEEILVQVQNGTSAYER